MEHVKKISKEHITCKRKNMTSVSVSYSKESMKKIMSVFEHVKKNRTMTSVFEKCLLEII